MGGGGRVGAVVGGIVAMGCVGTGVTNVGGGTMDVAGMPVAVGSEGTGVPVGTKVFLIGALRVLIGVRKTGAKAVFVAIGVAPACKSGQGCNATGNSRQLELSEQIFRLKVVACGPRQIRMRLPSTISAVRQVTAVDSPTSK